MASKVLQMAGVAIHRPAPCARSQPVHHSDRGCREADAEAIGRLVSLGLRAGVDPHRIIDQPDGIGGRGGVGLGKARVRSPADTLARIMKHVWFPAQEAEERAGAAEPEAPSGDGAVSGALREPAEHLDGHLPAVRRRGPGLRRG